jgi:hypothetical protein
MAFSMNMCAARISAPKTIGAVLIDVNPKGQ